MRRRLFGLLALISLVPCVASAAAWVRGQWVADTVEFAATRRYAAAFGQRGMALGWLETRRRRGNPNSGTDATGRLLAGYTETVDRYDEFVRLSLEPRWKWTEVRAMNEMAMVLLIWVEVDDPLLPRATSETKLLSIARSRKDDGTVVCEETWCFGKALWVPWWLAVAALAALPAGWLRRALARQRRGRRLRERRCPTCGYDLRASTGRCPECGAAA